MAQEILAAIQIIKETPLDILLQIANLIFIYLLYRKQESLNNRIDRVHMRITEHEKECHNRNLDFTERLGKIEGMLEKQKS